MDRIAEASVGEYASGKSQNAVNRSLDLARQGREVTLVDLDLVEPVYTLRPLKQSLEAEGIAVIAWETKETVGLGEAGIVLHPAMRWPLRRPGDVILDNGYGAKGHSVLNLLEGIEEEKDFTVLLVVNPFRPLTATEGAILAYIREIGRADALIANGSRGEETTVADIVSSFQLVRRAAEAAGLPVAALSVEERFRPDFPGTELDGVPLRWIKRWMPRGFW